MKFYPYKKEGGSRTDLSHNEVGGGGTTSFEVVLRRKLEVLAILICGCIRFHPLKGSGGVLKVLPCLEGERNNFWTHFCSPLSP